MLQQTFFPNRNDDNNSDNGWGVFFVVLVVVGTAGYFAYQMHQANSLQPNRDEPNPSTK